MRSSLSLVLSSLLLTGCFDRGVGAAPSAAEEEGALTQRKGRANDAGNGSAPPAKSAPREAGTPDAGIDWPDFLGPSRDNKSPEKGILTTWPERGLRIVWHKPVGESYGACVVANGRLFHFARFRDKSRLTAMNPRTGEELWRYEYKMEYADSYNYDNGPRCCPVVDDDRVYNFGVEGMLTCVRAADGQRLWQTNATEKFGVVQNFFGVGSTPVVAGDLIIANVGGSPPDSPSTYSGEVKPNGSGIVAFDKKSGEVKYKIADELASYASPTLANIGGRAWCFVFARGGLVGFEPASGKIDFHFPWRSPMLESVNAANPVVVDDKVLISECYSIGSCLLKVRPGGCDVVWKDGKRRAERPEHSMGTHWNTPIHVGGYLYGSSGRNTPDAELRCVEFDTGKVMWSEPGLERASLLFVDGHFVCLGENGVLRLIKANPEKYQCVATSHVTDENGERLLQSPAWAAPVLSHGLLYVRGANRLVCLELIVPRTDAATPR